MTEWVPLVPPPSAALVLTPASISEAGGVSTVTATLDRTTSAATTITVSAAAGAGAVAAAGGNGVSAAAGAGAVAAAGGNGVSAPSSATLTIADNDEKGLALVPSDHLAVTAGGTAGSYMAVLTSEPTGTVMVTVTSDNADVTVNPTSLTFDATDWSMAQTVTVTAAADGDDYADSASLTHDATGGGYGGVVASLPVAVMEAGDTRVLTAPVTAVTERVYRIGAEMVRVTYSPLAGDAVPSPAGSGFGLGDGDARVVVDVAVSGLPTGGLTLCLAAPQGIRDAAGRSPGRELVLLRYADGAWAPVTGSVWDATGMRVCASGVTSFSPFALGYADRSIEFAGTVPERLVYAVDEAIEPLVLPPVKEGTGDAPVTCCDLTPAGLPPGLSFDEATRTLSGTPTEVSAATGYGWTAGDADGPETLTFTIAVAIADDDTPTLSIDSPSVTEGTGTRGGTLRFLVSLSAASGNQVTVGYADGCGGALWTR